MFHNGKFNELGGYLSSCYVSVRYQTYDLDYVTSLNVVTLWYKRTLWKENTRVQIWSQADSRAHALTHIGINCMIPHVEAGYLHSSNSVPGRPFRTQKG